MKTLEEDFRIFAVLKFETGSNDYVEQRASLERASWCVIDSLRAAGFYSSIFTFPGWTREGDMGDFAIIHPVFPVNGFDCICVHVQPSPVTEAFYDNSLLTEVTDECQKALGESNIEILKEGGLSQLNSEGCWRNCRDAFENALITQGIRNILRVQGLKEGLIIVSSGDMPSDLWQGDPNENLFLFWLNLASAEPREAGFRFNLKLNGNM